MLFRLLEIEFEPVLSLGVQRNSEDSETGLALGLGRVSWLDGGWVTIRHRR